MLSLQFLLCSEGSGTDGGIVIVGELDSPFYQDIERTFADLPPMVKILVALHCRLPF